MRRHWTGPALFIISMCFIAVFLYISAVRLVYPYELQWMEGSILENVRRAAEGSSLYTQPSVQFVPYLYMPLYYYISAAVSFITGISYFTIRFVSLMAAIGCMAVIFAFAVRETGSWIAAVSAAGLFAAGYNLCGGYYDVGRIDTLMVFFLLAGLYLLRPDTAKTSCGGAAVPFSKMMLASVCFGMAFFTKQTALIAAAVMLIYLLISRVRHTYVFALTFGILAFGGCALLENTTGGWFSYYVFGLPLDHKLDLRGILVFTGLMAAYFTCYIIFPKIVKIVKSTLTFYYLSMTAAMAALSLAAFSNALFDLNLFIPAAAVMPVIFSLCVKHIMMTAGTQGHEKAGKKELLMRVLLVLQVVIMLYNPLKYIPSHEDIQAGRRVEEKINSLEGNVYIPAHPYLTEGRGGEKYTHIMPLYDLLELRRSVDAEAVSKAGAAAALRREFAGLLESGYFDYIILDNVNRLGFLQKLTEQYYMPAERLFEDGDDTFWTFSGAKRRPEYIYVRKQKNGE